MTHPKRKKPYALVRLQNQWFIKNQSPSIITFTLLSTNNPQSDRSNWYHPLGFAYKPDGAHADVDELEPGILPEGSTSGCDVDHSCPSPMYFMGDEYLGKYSNDESLVPTTEGEEDFGLDHYEPKFFHPLGEWTEYGDFSVTVMFDDMEYQKDIFYFCHVSILII